MNRIRSEAPGEFRTNCAHTLQRTSGQAWHTYCFENVGGNGLAFAGLKVPQHQ
jgi:hypothetical protein